MLFSKKKYKFTHLLNLTCEKRIFAFFSDRGRGISTIVDLIAATLSEKYSVAIVDLSITNHFYQKYIVHNQSPFQVSNNSEISTFKLNANVDIYFKKHNFVENLDFLKPIFDKYNVILLDCGTNLVNILRTYLSNNEYKVVNVWISSLDYFKYSYEKDLMESLDLEFFSIIFNKAFKDTDIIYLKDILNYKESKEDSIKAFKMSNFKSFYESDIQDDVYLFLNSYF